MAAKKKSKKKSAKRKGSKKTNKKLLTILGASAMVVIVTVALLVVLVVLPSAERNIAKGDAFLAIGEYNNARKSYGRAIHKEPSNLTYIHKFRDTINLITPVTPEEAIALFRDYLSTYAQEARYNPTNIDVQLMFVKELFSAAHLSAQNSYWREMHSVADSALDRVSLTDPRRHELILYRGLAQLRIENDAMVRDYDDEGNTRFPGEDDIEAVLEVDPENKVAWAALAHGRMAIYYRLKNEGRTQQAMKSRGYADETMAKAVEIAGDSLEVAETVLREVLLRRISLQQKYVASGGKIPEEQLDASRALIEEARDRLLATYDPAKHYIWSSEVASLLIGTGIDGRKYAIEMLQKHVAVHPKDYKRHLFLASKLRESKRFDEATESAKTILEAPKLQVSVEAIELFQLRPVSAQFLVQIATEQASLTEDTAERDALLLLAKDYRAELANLVSNIETNLLVIYSDGLIALADKQFELAAIKFEEVLRINPQSSAQVYREAAFALAESGAKGIARERLAVALATEPGNLSNYILKARIELMMSDYESAEATLAELPPIPFANEKVQELLDLIRFQKGGLDRFTDPILATIAQSERSTSLRDFDNAVEVLESAISGIDEPDWRLFAALSNVYIAMEDKPEAIIWVKKALVLEPDSAVLKNSLIVLENEDEIAATIAYIETLDESESVKAESLAVMLYELAMRKKAQARRWEMMGDKTQFEEVQELSDRALEESKKYQKLAEELGSDMTQIVRVQFDQAINDENMDLAIQLFAELTAESTNELELQGASVRIHLAQASIAKSNNDEVTFETEVNEAIAVAKSMTENVPFSDAAWRTLGTAYSKLGNQKETLAAYAEAYRIAPEDIENIRRYVGVLVIAKTEPQRLLRIVRRARQLFPKNKQMLAIWLELESTIGDRWKAYSYSYEEFKVNPDDRENSLKLALFLLGAEPSRELMRKPNGDVLYTSRVWNQMKLGEQAQLIRTTQKAWDVVVAAIIKRTSETLDRDIRMTVLHASVVKEHGEMDDASAIWDRFIESRTGTKEYTAAVIAAAEFLRESERADQAIELLKRARSVQSDKLEIDAALGSIYYLYGANKLAAESLTRVVQATGNRVLHALLIETLALSGQFSQAEEALGSFSNKNNAYSQAMLNALISRVKSEQMSAQGDVLGGRSELINYRGSLRTAIELDSNNPVPFIRLCRSLLNEYQLTQVTALLDEAMEVIAQGAVHFSESAEFAVIETDIFQASGQLQRAIEHLSAFLLENPEVNTARRRLIEAYLDSEEFDRALAVAQGGVDEDPSDATWYRRLGDLHVRINDDRAKAIVSYMSALQRKPSQPLLLRIDDITRTDQTLPDRAIIAMMQGSISKMHPITGAIEAKSLMNIGRRRDALQAMADSWSAFMHTIDNGWLPASATASWFLDLQQIFSDEPSAGEKFVMNLLKDHPTPDQLAGIAGYWQAFGSEYFDKALDVIDETILLVERGSSQWSRLLMLKGGYLVEAQRYAESADAFRLLSEEERSPLVLNNLAYVVGVYLNQPEEGLELAKQAALKAPRNSAVIDTVAEMHERVGDATKAAETLEFLLQIDPANALAMARLAILYAGELNQPDRAVLIALRGRSQNPRSPEVLDAMGWSYYQTGKEGKGLELIQRSLKRGMTMKAYLHMAQIVMKNSSFDEALGYLRMAQELAQDDYSLNSIKVIQDDIRKIQASVDE